MRGTVSVFRGSILETDTDVIVNAANRSLAGGGGVDGVVHRAAGPELKEYCKPLAPCEPGDVKVSPAFNLSNSFIFHTVGPIWKNGNEGEPEILKMCYKNCLSELVKRDLRSITFPAISTGAYSYPQDLAAQIAIETSLDFAKLYDIEIVLVAIERKTANALERAVRNAQE